MITEELFMWLISGLCMVIGFMLVWIIKSIVNEQKEQKAEMVVIRDEHIDLRIDHERLSKDVQALVDVVKSNEIRDNRRLEVMEKIIQKIR